MAAACNDDAGDATDDVARPPPSAPTSAATEVSTVAGTDATEATDAPAPAADAVLTFGLLAPDAGLLNTLVVGQQRGLQLALDDINAAGGVLGGPAASVSVAESADTPLADSVAQLVDQGAGVIVGPVGSATAAELLPVLAERQLLACSASATATSLTVGADVSAPPLFVRTALRDDHLAAIVADLLMAPADGAAPPASVMVVGRDDVYGNELTAGLAAELAARGAATTTLAYPSRRVQFPDEAAEIAAAAPDRVVLVSFEEGPRLVADLAAAGYPVDHIVGLDGMLLPTVAEQAFPSDPAPGRRAHGHRHDGGPGARQPPAADDRLAGPDRLRAADVRLRHHGRPRRHGRRVDRDGGDRRPDRAGDVGRAERARRSPTASSCWRPARTSTTTAPPATSGSTPPATSSTARVTTARVIDGQLQPVARQDVDLEAQRQDAVFASAVFVAQLQQALKVLGYFDGDVTGIYDDATTAAVAALQHDLGLPDTGQYDAATDAALRARVGDRLGTIGTGIMELQQALADRGYYQGPIDGRFSDATVAAIKAFQTDLGVPPTGIIDVATLQAIYARGVATGELLVPPPPETTVPPKPPATTVATGAATADGRPDDEAADRRRARPPTTAPPDEADHDGRRRATVDAAAERPEPLRGAVARQPVHDLHGPRPRRRLRQRPRPARTVHRVRPDERRVRGDGRRRARPSCEADPEAADALLRDLIVEGAINAKQLVPGPLRTIGGGTIVVAGTGDQMTVGGAAIELPNRIIASNGIVHGLAAVPTPG